jgi:hypothetical protein
MKPPRDLPSDILEQLAGYLRLEFGEYGPHAIGASDLTYAGEQKDGRAKIHFWEFPTSSGRAWVTARATKSGYAISPTSIGPNGERGVTQSTFDILSVTFQALRPRQKRIAPLKLEIADLEDDGVPVTFPSGEELYFYAEVAPAGDGFGPQVALRIVQDDDVVFEVLCTSGVRACLTLAGYDCTMEVGPGPWKK